MIVFGIRLFGKAEIVPGVFFIATRFFHICFIPLFPMQSFVILEGPDQDGGGAALPGLHWGSISMGYLRGLLLVGAVVLSVMAWNKVETHAVTTQVRPMLLLALGCVAGFAGSYRLARASAESLEALRGVAGVPAQVITRAKERLGG
jgi:hypothetical protein